MGKLINPRTGEEQLIEVRITEPATRELEVTIVTEDMGIPGETVDRHRADAARQ